MTTTKWASVAIGVVVALSVTACGSGASGGSSGDITLGGIGPLTGAFADVGQAQQQGAQIAIDQINAKGGLLNGRKLSLSFKDTAKGAQASTQAIRDYASSGTSLILGELSSDNCLADAPLIEQLNEVFVVGACTNQAMTGENGAKTKYDRVFRTGATDIQDMQALADTMKRQFPDVRTYDSIAFDYVSGHSEWDEFLKDFKDSGNPLTDGKVIFAPLSSQSFSSQISVLNSASQGSSKRGLYVGTYGSGTASFLQQAAPYNLLKNYDVVVNPGGYYPIARNMNGSAPEVWNGYDYNYAAYNTAENTAFVNDFEAKYHQKPDTWSYQTYLGVLAYAAAIDKAKSTDPAQVAGALRGISFDSPQGKFTIDGSTQQGSANIVVTDTSGDATSPEKLKVLKLVVVRPDGSTQ